MGIDDIRRLNAKRTGYAPPESQSDKASPPPAPTAAGLTKWFKRCRDRMTGFCQCGCGTRSQRDVDSTQKQLDGKPQKDWYKSSAAHIYPKKDFPSVALHPDNWVERSVFNGCHSNMDHRGMDRWPNMADWPDIVAKFHMLQSFLTKEERTKKFHKKLADLVKTHPI